MGSALLDHRIEVGADVDAQVPTEPHRPPEIQVAARRPLTIGAHEGKAAFS